MTSFTTRRPRPGDGEGKSYEYVSREEFDRIRKEEGFLESAEVHGELYGTPRQELERLLAEGNDVVLEIDVQGAHQVRAAKPEAVTIFLEPPDWETLETRLAGRGTEDEEAFKKRLATAKKELGEAGSFDHRVVNDDLERAVDEVDRILEQVMNR